MLSVRARLISTVFISQAGNWLTFVGLLQYVQARFGSSATVGVFVAQTLPALVGARVMAERIPPHRVHQVWLGMQFTLALCSLSLAAWNAPLWHVYGFFAVTTLMRAIATPLFMTLVSSHVPAAERASTYTSIGVASSVTLSLSPAAGGVIAAVLGYNWLFILDAVTFVLGAGVLLRVGVPAVDGSEPSRSAGPGRPSTLLRAWIGRPDGTTPRLAGAMTSWTWFSVVGAAVTAVEVPVFSEIHGFDAGGFGAALAAYGFGGVAALIISQIRKGWTLPASTLAALYCASLVIWVVGGTAGAFAGFFVAGLAYDLLAGRLRLALDQDLRASVVTPVALWAWAGQATLIANLVVYGLSAAAFWLGIPVIAVAIAAVATAIGLTAQTLLVTSARGRVSIADEG